MVIHAAAFEDGGVEVADVDFLVWGGDSPACSKRDAMKRSTGLSCAHSEWVTSGSLAFLGGMYAQWASYFAPSLTHLRTRAILSGAKMDPCGDRDGWRGMTCSGSLLSMSWTSSELSGSPGMMTALPWSRFSKANSAWSMRSGCPFPFEIGPPGSRLPESGPWQW